MTSTRLQVAQFFCGGKKIAPKKNEQIKSGTKKTSVEHFLNKKTSVCGVFWLFRSPGFSVFGSFICAAPSHCPVKLEALKRDCRGVGRVLGGLKCEMCGMYTYIYMNIYMFTTKPRKIEIRFISHVCALIYTYMVLMYIIIGYLYNDTLYIVNRCK